MGTASQWEGTVKYCMAKVLFVDVCVVVCVFVCVWREKGEKREE